jgi:hypothetical protein
MKIDTSAFLDMVSVQFCRKRYYSTNSLIPRAHKKLLKRSKGVILKRFTAEIIKSMFTKFRSIAPRYFLIAIKFSSVMKQMFKGTLADSYYVTKKCVSNGMCTLLLLPLTSKSFTSVTRGVMFQVRKAELLVLLSLSLLDVILIPVFKYLNISLLPSFLLLKLSAPPRGLPR